MGISDITGCLFDSIQDFKGSLPPHFLFAIFATCCFLLGEGIGQAK